MRINSMKTKVWTCAREPTFNTNIYSGNHPIARVSSFKYSDSLITADRKSWQEIKQKIGQAKTAFIKKREIWHWEKWT